MKRVNELQLENVDMKSSDVEKKHRSQKGNKVKLSKVTEYEETESIVNEGSDSDEDNLVIINREDDRGELIEPEVSSEEDGVQEVIDVRDESETEEEERDESETEDEEEQEVIRRSSRHKKPKQVFTYETIGGDPSFK